MFDPQRIEDIRKFYSTYEPAQRAAVYRSIRASVGSVKNIFYGDSITAAWPLHEFFPNASILNRGIGGDNSHGLYDRMSEDVLPYSPKRVFLTIGINEIWDDEALIQDHIKALATILAKAGISVVLGSILPLRHPDNWNRFQFQDKIVRINAGIRAWAEANTAGFLDYHGAVKDTTGQLAAECAQPDGTHVTFEAYRRMSALAAPYLVA